MAFEIEGTESVVPALHNVELRAVYSEVKAEASTAMPSIADVRRCGAVVRVLEEVSR